MALKGLFEFGYRLGDSDLERREINFCENLKIDFVRIR